MLPFLVLGLASVSIAAVSAPAHSPRQDEPSKGYLSLTMKQSRFSHNIKTTSPWINLRDEPLDTNLTKVERWGTLYTVELEIGTPTQTVFVQFDTGSDELWVNPNCAKADPDNSNGIIGMCQGNGLYSPSLSSTSASINCTGEPCVPPIFDISYGSGRAWGQYYQDDVHFTGANLVNTQFGVANSSSNFLAGILGMGFGKGFSTTYNTILDQLVAQSHILTRSFSVGLGSITTEIGELLFSGIDTGKYSGNLKKISLLYPGPDRKYRYWITQTSLGLSDSMTCKSEVFASSMNLDIVVDTGASFTYMPEQILNATVAKFPDAVFDESTTLWTVPCYHRDHNATLDFGFGDAIINVPFKEFIWQMADDDLTCYLGMLPSTAGTPILGDNFLRAAYVVFDQDRQALFMANYQDCGSQVLSVTEESLLEPGLCSASTVGKCAGRGLSSSETMTMVSTVMTSTTSCSDTISTLSSKPASTVTNASSSAITMQSNSLEKNSGSSSSKTCTETSEVTTESNSPQTNSGISLSTTCSESTGVTTGTATVVTTKSNSPETGSSSASSSTSCTESSLLTTASNDAVTNLGSSSSTSCSESFISRTAETWTVPFATSMWSTTLETSVKTTVSNDAVTGSSAASTSTSCSESSTVTTASNDAVTNSGSSTTTLCSETSTKTTASNDAVTASANSTSSTSCSETSVRTTASNDAITASLSFTTVSTSVSTSTSCSESTTKTTASNDAITASLSSTKITDSLGLTTGGTDAVTASSSLVLSSTTITVTPSTSITPSANTSRSQGYSWNETVTLPPSATVSSFPTSLAEARSSTNSLSTSSDEATTIVIITTIMPTTVVVTRNTSIVTVTSTADAEGSTVTSSGAPSVILTYVSTQTVTSISTVQSDSCPSQSYAATLTLYVTTTAPAM